MTPEPGQKVRRKDWPKHQHVTVQYLHNDIFTTDEAGGGFQALDDDWEKYDPFPFWYGAKIQEANDNLVVEIVAIGETTFIGKAGGLEIHFSQTGDWRLVVDTPPTLTDQYLMVREHDGDTDYIVYPYHPRDPIPYKGESLWRCTVTPTERIAP